MKMHIKIYSFFQGNLILSDAVVRLLTPLCCIAVYLHQRIPQPAVISRKNSCAHSKILQLNWKAFAQIQRLCLFITVTSAPEPLGWDFPQRGSRQLWQRFDWHVNGASGGQLQFPPHRPVWCDWRWDGALWTSVSHSFLGVNHSSHLSFLGANCQQMIHNLNSVEFCGVKPSTVFTKQPLALPSV